MKVNKEAQLSNHRITAMTTTFSDSALLPQTSDFAALKTVLVEPALAVGAVSLLDHGAAARGAFVARRENLGHAASLGIGFGVRPNPLILRRGLPRNGLAIRNSARTAQI